MFARTDRLLLRPGWPEDAPALAAAIGEERIVRNLARAPWPYGEEEARGYLATSFDGPLPAFVIVARQGGRAELAGGIGFGRDDDGEIELGYWLASRFWDRGFATEAGRALVALARDGLRLPRLVSGHFVDNPASGRVLEKLGFTATGDIVLRHSAARGEAVPLRRYVLELSNAGQMYGEPGKIAA